MSNDHEPSRRRFLKRTAGAVMAGAALGSMSGRPAVAQTQRSFKVVLIGCGGRGKGALRDHRQAVAYLNETLGWDLKSEVVALADWFADRADGAADAFEVPKDRCMSGADAYKKAIDAGPDLVLMAQPPSFRPRHFAAAIDAGKHVFFEKPSAVDPPGVRQVIEAGEKAKAQGLAVVAGTQRRHDQRRNREIRIIREGARGRIMAGRVAWNASHFFNKSPVNAQSVDDFVGSWKVWIELSGDHICEQHVHNLDIANWYLDAHPISAAGFGGRARRPAGNMYDFFSIDFEYPDGIHVHSMCRQINQCWRWVGESFTYEKDAPEGYEPHSPDPYADVGYAKASKISEHAHLLHSIVTENPLNEARNVAWATGAAVLGRESTYTGQRITWEEMFENPDKKPETYNLTLKPTAEDFETGDVTIPTEGEAPIPGVEAR
jgi:predicted dehydrogenase